ncbi:NAD(P)-dependent oxidoreductase [Mycobacterium sp. SMC-8]|nr:NAD(P)-dependent oxidoreductase [Mycobacterium sp. SMC-8]UXA11540.1 NAD(P)-dependent oxidoreductase [Mycobacterium sp. SMC-8]
MAEMIMRAGHDLTIWARRAAVARDYARRGASTVAQAAELARNCEVICLCVTGDSDVREIVEKSALLDEMRPGAVLIIHSTVSPGTCTDIATAADECGVHLLDAPVSGGRAAALAGRLLVLAGGDEEVLDRVRPILGSYGDPIIHVGGVGDGQRSKIVNNFMCIANMAVVDTALRLGEALSLERTALQRTCLNGSGASFALSVFDTNVLPAAERVSAVFRKDADLATALACESNTDVDAVSALIDQLIHRLNPSNQEATGRERP